MSGQFSVGLTSTRITFKRTAHTCSEEEAKALARPQKREHPFGRRAARGELWIQNVNDGSAARLNTLELTIARRGSFQWTDPPLTGKAGELRDDHRG